MEGDTLPRALQHDIYLAVVTKDQKTLLEIIRNRELTPKCDFFFKGRHILAIAVEKADLVTVKLLLDGGASLHPQTCVKGGPLHLADTLPICVAIKLNKWAIFEELCSRGFRDNDEALACAAWHCCVERRPLMFQRLLQEPNAPDLLVWLLYNVGGDCPYLAGIRKFLARQLHVIVATNFTFGTWKARIGFPTQDFTLPFNSTGISLVVAIGCGRECATKPQQETGKEHSESRFFSQLVSKNSSCFTYEDICKKFLEPLPLKMLARISIRNFLAKIGRFAVLCRLVDGGLQKEVSSLFGIPVKLASYLMFVEERREFQMRAYEKEDEGNNGTFNFYLNYVQQVS